MVAEGSIAEVLFVVSFNAEVVLELDALAVAFPLSESLRRPGLV